MQGCLYFSDEHKTQVSGGSGAWRQALQGKWGPASVGTCQGEVGYEMQPMEKTEHEPARPCFKHRAGGSLADFVICLRS